MSFSTAVTVDRSPDDVFATVNDVRSWWTGEIDAAPTSSAASDDQ